MVSNRILIASVLIALLLHSEMIVFAEPIGLLRDIVQYTIAGIPLVHQNTEWNFNPKISKERRVQYEQENGRYGEHTIAKLGMGIGYKSS